MINCSNSLFLVFSTVVFLCSSNADTCINHDPCLCQINENDKINISALSEDIKAPKYLSDTDGNLTYTFLGCKDQNFPTDNKTVTFRGTLILTNHTWKNNNSVNEYKVIGRSDWARFNKDDDGYMLTYANNSEPLAIITLLCNRYKEPYLKITDLQKQSLILSSPKLCIQTEEHGMSGGSIFLLILFIVAGIYFVGGAALLYFIRGARGVEMIPNIDFWRNLPGLVKDGLIFLLSGCKPNFVTTAETYDRI
ncbi:cation-dependent mannose-6-phosphate receptor-like [Diabrotica undecimpunctata]|uniref:cation-dependent mannose-6-phosphate receptor-like n=1 Tax=Diabrotica undecimpunctata TaxID=50387 RepID=UPI003B63C7D1